jgi:hypothetical protein
LLNLPEGTDGIRISTLTEQALAQFLGRSTGMVSCNLCSGLDPQVRHRANWREERDPVKWTKESTEERRAE